LHNFSSMYEYNQEIQSFHTVYRFMKFSSVLYVLGSRDSEEFIGIALPKCKVELFTTLSSKTCRMLEIINEDMTRYAVCQHLQWKEKS
jgi:hypothetical protein